MVTDLSELLERCRTATGPDRELDAAIYVRMFVPEDAGRIDVLGGLVGYWPRNAPYVSAVEVPNYTASIDAALALVERCLPGWGIEIGIPAKRGGIGNSRLYPGDERNAEMTYFGSGQNPALAILSALIQSLGETP